MTNDLEALIATVDEDDEDFREFCGDDEQYMKFVRGTFKGNEEDLFNRLKIEFLATE